MPHAVRPRQDLSGELQLPGLARLKPGVTMAQASADVARMIPIALQLPPFPGFSRRCSKKPASRPELRPLSSDVVGNIGGTLWVLMGTIGMVLLIACANVANLLLVRAEGRQQELAIRAALGAGPARDRPRTAAGKPDPGRGRRRRRTGLAYGALRLLVKIGPRQSPALDEISIDGWVLLFTLAVSLAAGLLFGAIPVLKYAGPHIAASACAAAAAPPARAGNGIAHAASGGGPGGPGAGPAHQLRPDDPLLPGLAQRPAGLHPSRADPDPAHLHSRDPGADEAAVMRMEQAILDRLAAIPGVASAALSSRLPMDGSGWTDPVYAEDHAYAEGQLPPCAISSSSRPGSSPRHGQPPGGRPRFHLDRPLRQTPRGHGLRKYGARNCGARPRPPSASASASPSASPGAKSSAWWATSTTTAWTRSPPPRVYWPAAHGQLRRQQDLRAARRGHRDPQHPHRHAGLPE